MKSEEKERLRQNMAFAGLPTDKKPKKQRHLFSRESGEEWIDYGDPEKWGLMGDIHTQDFLKACQDLAQAAGRKIEFEIREYDDL